MKFVSSEMGFHGLTKGENICSHCKNGLEDTIYKHRSTVIIHLYDILCISIGIRTFYPPTPCSAHTRSEFCRLRLSSGIHLGDVSLKSWGDSQHPGYRLTHWVTMQTKIDLGASRAGDKSHNEKCNHSLQLWLLGGLCPHILPLAHKK